MRRGRVNRHYTTYVDGGAVRRIDFTQPEQPATDARGVLSKELDDAQVRSCDSLGQHRVGEDDPRHDQAEDNRVLGHCLGLLAHTAETDAVEPAMESHTWESALRLPSQMPLPGDSGDPTQVRSYARCGVPSSRWCFS